MRSTHAIFMLLMLGLPGLSKADAIRVPGGTAYFEPQPEPPGGSISEPDGVTGWTDAKTLVAWYGQIASRGRLDIAASVQLPAGEHSRLHLAVERLARDSGSDGQWDAPLTENGDDTAAINGDGQANTVQLGSVAIDRPGTYRFVLEGVSKTGNEFGDISSLLLDGPAAQDAHFSQAKTRGAPSVHLWYQYPKDARVSWFYNEVTVKTDPLWSYYMACGFSRGYFGIQVNSPTERRIIFSVWNAGDEPTDPGKVPQEDRVQLLGKGEGVFAGEFGNEGTGGHSHLVYPWKTGHTYRFLVSAQPDGTATIYSGYFYFPEKKRWGLIASFRAPKDGGMLRGLYSFNEDFNGANGYERRLAEFGPSWIKTGDGAWTELTTVHFTHTGDGKTERLDRAAGVSHRRFFLSNGGFLPVPGVKYGDAFTRPATNRPPKDIVLPQLDGAGR